MKSYARGAHVPLLEKTVSQALRDTAARFPNNEALVSYSQNTRLTYRELDEQADLTAAGLWGLGLRPGDRVGVWSTSCVEWVYLQAATARIGAVMVNVNPAYRSHDLNYVLKRSGMKALFLHERDARADYARILEEAARGEQLALRHTVFLGSETWQDMIGRGLPPPHIETSPGDVVNIQYTSGTTGAPKGCLLTHRNLVNNAFLLGRGLRITNQDRIAVPVPLYHCFGCVIGSLVAIVFGAAMVLPSPTFDALATLQAIQEERCTVIYGVPAMFIAELEHPDFASFDMTSLRTGVMAGAPCPIELMKRVVTQMHCPEMTIAYGQTETSPAITMSSCDDDIEKRVSTIGRVLPDTEVKIAALDGTPVDVGEQGELCTRGYHVMKGYDGDRAATMEAIDRDGWLRTGDLAVMRPDGYFRVVGRAREMIIRGGENIYPREIEEFLHTHPKVAEVAAVGVPDLRLGETVAVWIRLRAGASATEEEIRSFCAGKLAHFKVPEFIRFVDSFPMTASGKVQKYRMRAFEVEARELHAAAKIETA